MGLFDGHRDGVTPTSTAEVAARIGAPVVLVVDASRLAASAGAIALGFATFDPDVRRGRRDPEPLEPAALAGRPSRRRSRAQASMSSGTCRWPPTSSCPRGTSASWSPTS